MGEILKSLRGLIFYVLATLAARLMEPVFGWPSFISYPIFAAFVFLGTAIFIADLWDRTWFPGWAKEIISHPASYGLATAIALAILLGLHADGAFQGDNWKPRTLTSDQQRLFRSELRNRLTEPVTISLIYEADCTDCRRYHALLKDVLGSVSGARVGTGWKQTPSVSDPSGLLVYVSSQENPTNAERALLAALDRASIPYGVRVEQTGSDLELYVDEMLISRE